MSASSCPCHAQHSPQGGKENDISVNTPSFLILELEMGPPEGSEGGLGLLHIADVALPEVKVQDGH